MSWNSNRTRGIGVAVAALAAAAWLCGCSRGQDATAGGKAEEDAAAAAGERPGTIEQAPWMDGERWGMPPSEVAARLGAAPVLQSESSDYYLTVIAGRPVLAQYVFGKAAGGAERTLVRKIAYLANPKRAAYLPPMAVDEAKEAFNAVKASLEAVYGNAPVDVEPMAVSPKLESQARSTGDRVAAAEREVRALERAMEARRKELQKQYAGQKNRNALVASGLVELEKPLQVAQRKLIGFKSEQHQVLAAIREECEALPEAERPFHWQSDWTGADGTAAMYLTVNARGAFLSVSFTAPE